MNASHVNVKLSLLANYFHLPCSPPILESVFAMTEGLKTAEWGRGFSKETQVKMELRFPSAP